MLIPAKVDLKAYRGGTFSTKLFFWKTLEPLEEFPLPEYTPEVVIDDYFTLTVGNGLTAVNNELTLQLTPTQTEKVPINARAHYKVRLVKGAEVVFPSHGTLSFIDP